METNTSTPSTTTTTTSTTNSNNNNNNNNKPKSDKPRQPRPPREPRDNKAKSENGSEDSSKPAKPQQPRHSKPKAQKPQNNNNNNTTTTTTATGAPGVEGENKPQGRQHNHNHSHNHNHHNKKPTTTTTTTTTTTNPKHQHHQQQPKIIEFNSDKSFSTLLNILRFETTPPIVDQCIICCDPIVFYGKGVCEHIEVCSFCLLRQRELYKDYRCCICKTESKTIIVTDDKEKKYEEYQLTDLSFNNKLNAYFTNSDFKKSLPRLWEPVCQVCDQHLGTLKRLELHLTTEHALMYCQICLADRKVFLAEQNLYEPKKLPIHMSEWDGGAGITIAGKKKGHPTCKFCNKYYYGNDQFDFAKIRHHFNDEHYPCMHPECLEKKFIVFPDELSLKSHEISTHLDSSKMSKGQRRNATQVQIP
ncbi:hypothetical protein ACTFIW_011827 [Dictyostelium discoideum]